jgi:flagellin
MRIGSSLSGADLVAQHNLAQAMALLNAASVRLSTMQRINRGADDPAGLIAMGQLEAELTSLEALDTSAGRMVGAIHVADSAMAEVGDLLNAIRGDVVEAASAGLSEGEVAAKQMEIDAALGAINRIGGSTGLAGRPLLDGSYTLTLSPGAGPSSSLTLPEISTAALGSNEARLSELASGGSASLASGNFVGALKALDAAQSQVLNARAEAGAFEQYTIQSTQRLLGNMEESIASSIGQIRDTDVAAETSRLIRSQILVDAGISALRLTSQSRRLASRLLSGP